MTEGVGTSSLPFVSILIVSRNDQRTISDSVLSVLGQDYPQAFYEVIVYDDHSDREQVELLRELVRAQAARVAAGQFRVIFGAVHRGLSAGRNEAARAARGTVLCYLDGDGYADPRWIRSLVPRFGEAGVGVVGSRVVYARNPELVNGQGAILNYFAAGHDRYGHQPVTSVPEVGEYVCYVMGCGLCTTRECWETLGGFDPKIMYAYDDADYGLRAWIAGYKVVTAPDAVVRHDTRTPMNGACLRRRLYFEKTRWRIMLKFWPLRILALSFVYQAHLIRRGHVELPPLGLLLCSWMQLLPDLPCILGHRRRAGRNAAHAFWALLDHRHSVWSSSTILDVNALHDLGRLMPFSRAACDDPLHVRSVGRLGGPGLTLMQDGRMRFALFESTERVLIDFVQAEPGVVASAMVTTAGRRETWDIDVGGPQGRLDVAVPRGSSACEIRVSSLLPVRPDPLTPKPLITFMRICQL